PASHWSALFALDREAAAGHRRSGTRPCAAPPDPEPSRWAPSSFEHQQPARSLPAASHPTSRTLFPATCVRQRRLSLGTRGSGVTFRRRAPAALEAGWIGLRTG